MNNVETKHNSAVVVYVGGERKIIVNILGKKSKRTPRTLYSAVVMAREISDSLGVEAYVAKHCNENEWILSPIPKGEFTSDGVRQLLAQFGVTSDNIKLEEVLELRKIVNKHLKASEIYDGTARLRKIKVRSWKMLRVKTNEWEDREAISFGNSMIGFAGWASTSNTAPFLSATVEWLYNKKF